MTLSDSIEGTPRAQAVGHVSRALGTLEGLSALDQRFASILRQELGGAYAKLVHATGAEIPADALDRSKVQHAVDMLGVTPQLGEVARHLSNLRHNIHLLLELL